MWSRREDKKEEHFLFPWGSDPKLGKKKVHPNRETPTSIPIALFCLPVSPSSLLHTDPRQAHSGIGYKRPSTNQACSPWLLHDTKLPNRNPSNWLLPPPSCILSPCSQPSVTFSPLLSFHSSLSHRPH